TPFNQGTRVHVKASVDLDAQLLDVTLTGPPDGFGGYGDFLPPDATAIQPQGLGFITFTVGTRKKAQAMVPFSVQANIKFDTNPVVPTNPAPDGGTYILVDKPVTPRSAVASALPTTPGKVTLRWHPPAVSHEAGVPITGYRISEFIVTSKTKC